MCIFKDFLSSFYTFLHQYSPVVMALFMHTTPWDIIRKSVKGAVAILEDPFFMLSVTETEVNCVTMLLLTCRQD